MTTRLYVVLVVVAVLLGIASTIECCNGAQCAPLWRQPPPD